MGDSRTISNKIMGEIQKVVGIQERVIYFLISVILAFIITLSADSEALNTPQIYVLFLLVFSICLWITEAIPPFAVGLLIIGFLIFSLGNYYIEVDPENASALTQKYAQTWSNSVIWLMLGGFFLAEAMQKVGLDKTVFKLSISKFGTQPKYVLLGLMLTTAIFSMIMSNTATTAMMIAAVSPFLKTLDPKAKYTKAVLIGVPAAAAMGGMGTIIGSPTNAIAVEALNNYGINFGFLEWMAVGFPTAIIMTFIMWLFLIKRYVPKVSHIDLGFISEGSPEEGSNDKIFKLKKKIVSAILLVTLALWMTGNFHGIPASTVSLIPIIFLTMFRIISSEDVRKLPWDTLMLVAGGMSLGLAIQETGLASYYVGQLQDYHLPFAGLVAFFAVLTVVLSNFMSNTAATTILIPIAIIMAPENPIILPLVIGLSASTALFFPISTPPNAIAFSTGLIEQKDFRPGGIIAGLIGPIIVILIITLFQISGLI